MVGRPHFPTNIDKVVSSKNQKKGVWQRKTDSEIEKVKQKLRSSSFNLVMPSAIFFIGFITCFVFYSKNS